jgi:hypothetical protein
MTVFEWRCVAPVAGISLFIPVRYRFSFVLALQLLKGQT